MSLEKGPILVSPKIDRQEVLSYVYPKSILQHLPPMQALGKFSEIANSCSPTPTPKKEQDISHISQAALNVLSLAKKKKKEIYFWPLNLFPPMCISAEMLSIWFRLLPP